MFFMSIIAIFVGAFGVTTQVRTHTRCRFNRFLIDGENYLFLKNRQLYFLVVLSI